mgnify:CR=1 FL=1
MFACVDGLPRITGTLEFSDQKLGLAHVDAGFLGQAVNNDPRITLAFIIG